jgi:ribonuclease Z
MQMRKFSVKFQRIDIILISHLHGDHYFGLVGLLSTMHLLGRVKKLQIYSQKGLSEIIKAQLLAGNSEFGYEIEIIEIEEGYSGTLFEDEKIRIHSFPLKHKIPTNGFVITEKEKERSLLADKAKAHGVLIEYYHRLKAGEDVIREDGFVFKSVEYTLPGSPEKSYAFCSDTAYHEPVVEHIKGVDLLYHEGTFIESKKDRAIATRHSTAKDAAKIARLAKVKQLVIGHLSARYDSGDVHRVEAMEEFENSVIAEDGVTYIIG